MMEEEGVMKVRSRMPVMMMYSGGGGGGLWPSVSLKGPVLSGTGFKRKEHRRLVSHQLVPPILACFWFIWRCF